MITSSHSHLRPAFSMMTAIFVIVLMAGVTAMVFDLTGKTIKETTAQYQREQSILLSRSYTELAIMAVSARDITINNCLRDIGGKVGSTSNINQGQGYKIQTNIYYIGDGYNSTNCAATRVLDGSATTDVNSTLNIIVDTYVKYRDIDLVDLYMNTHGGTAPGATDLPWMTYHKRTLQKI